MSAAFRVLLAIGLASAISLANAFPQTNSSWRFEVYLDDSRIGFHEFELEEQADGRLKLQANARYDVKFLFINAFRYRHNIEEIWRGNCLTDIDASTNSNGSKTRVEGELTEQGFQIETGESERALGACVMTFAYWNPAFLKQSRLLNPQTGEFLEVEVEALTQDTVRLHGRDVAANGYLIKARNMEVKVWYSENQVWLALESPTKSGRVLRYERQS